MSNIIIPKEPGIYKIECTDNGKIYVGSAVNLFKRKIQHFHNLNNGKHPNRHLQNAFCKYGEESFNFSTLELCEIKLLIDREQYWINSLKPKFNIRKIAESNLGIKYSDEARKKISDAVKSRTISEETRKRMSKYASNMGEEHRKRISEANKGRKRSPQDRKNVSEGLRKFYEENRSKNCKPIHRLDRKTGEILATYSSAIEASKNLHCGVDSIYAVCGGRRKSSHGFGWRYVGS